MQVDVLPLPSWQEPEQHAFTGFDLYPSSRIAEPVGFPLIPIAAQELTSTALSAHILQGHQHGLPCGSRPIPFLLLNVGLCQCCP